jgi:hypothetical protein
MTLHYLVSRLRGQYRDGWSVGDGGNCEDVYPTRWAEFDLPPAFTFRVSQGETMEFYDDKGEHCDLVTQFGHPALVSCNHRGARMIGDSKP